jgi:PilZ domain
MRGWEATVFENNAVTAIDIWPARRPTRLTRNFLCKVAVDGLSMEGRTMNLSEQGLAVALPEPLFWNLDSATVAFTVSDGSLFQVTGRVVRQYQSQIGEVILGIQLADLSVDTTRALVENCATDSPFRMESEPFRYPEPRGRRGWIRSFASHPLISPPARWQIPCLPIHTACAIFVGRESTYKGLTQDLSYAGLSVLFPDFNPGQLWGAILHIRFVKLKALPIGIDHRGADALVRFRVDHIEEGKQRWQDLHYSY